MLVLPRALFVAHEVCKLTGCSKCHGWSQKMYRCLPSAAVQAWTPRKPTTHKVEEVVPFEKLLVFNVTWLYE